MNAKKKDEICFSIVPRPPFRLDLTAWTIRRKPHNLMDLWDGVSYQRVVPIEGTPVLIHVSQNGSGFAPRLHIRAAGNLIPRSAKHEILRVLKNVLGYRLSMEEFYSFSRKDFRLKALALRFQGMKPPRFPSVFEALINGICCQQLSLHVGILLLNRLCASYGLPIRLSPEGATRHAFPRPQDLTRATHGELKAMGFSRQKADYLIHVSQRISSGTLDLEALQSLENEAVVQKLMELPGVGRWTAEYVLLRGLGRINCFPADDVGARNKLSRWLHLRKPLDYEKTRRILKVWEPYAGLIYFHLLLQHLEEDHKDSQWDISSRERLSGLQPVSVSG